MLRCFRPLALLGAWLLAPALALAAPSTQPLSPEGPWALFRVDSFVAPAADPGVFIDDNGDPLSFSFDLAGPGQLRVVDLVAPGETFTITVNGVDHTSSAVPQADFLAAPNVGYDAQAAWADPAYSRLVLNLGAGHYTVSGHLLQSGLFGGMPSEATAGAIAVVPEPGQPALLLAGLLVLGWIAQARSRRDRR